ncbi:MAG TPA: peroxiredoxin [Chitinophagaceae bacterium]|nr:peroxiredoxin [Chitinophagaceae bacterium]
MANTHHYTINLEWTGDKGSGTSSYVSYSRDHIIKSVNKPAIEGSSDPMFRGDPRRYNPEELFLSSLAACHMLWYLHLCADHAVIVKKYTDQPVGQLQEDPAGGKFTEVILRPTVTVTNASMLAKARELHREAHRQCFIANSCNFPVRHEPVCEVLSAEGL